MSMFMAIMGAASKTYDEIMATLHLNKNTIDLLKKYNDLLKNLLVSIKICFCSSIKLRVLSNYMDIYGNFEKYFPK